MSDKQASKRMHRACAGPLLSAAGLSLSLASSAPAATVGPAAHEITLSEEEISDVSLATFFVFDKENPRTPGLQLVRGGGGCGCGGCGCGGGGHGGCGGGGGGGGGHGGCGGGGGYAHAGVAHAGAWGGGHMGGGRGGPHTTGPVGPRVSHFTGRFDHGHHFDHEHDHLHNRFVRNRFFFAGGWWPYYYDYGYNCWWLRRKAVITGSPYWWRRYDLCVGYY